MAKILIADDDAILRDILISKLQADGFTVLSTPSGTEAIKLLKTEHPDLLLLDLLVQDKDGTDVLEEMRADASIKDIPVIVITNNEDKAAITETARLGVKDYIIKTMSDSNAVVGKIHEVLSRSTTPRSAPTDATLPQPQPTGASGNKKTVLIIEDDKFLRELAAGKLREEGNFNVLEAGDSKEAADHLAKGPMPQVIILDLILPGLGGFEILGQLKKDPKTQAVPVIILSNLGDEADIAKAKQLGAFDFLIKAHFSFGEIMAKIKNALGNS